MPRKKKEIEVIQRDGAKTVAKKTSLIVWTKRVFAVFSVLWLGAVISVPLYIKNNYETPIKQALVVSLFYDMQRDIADEYTNALNGLKSAIDLEKPIKSAFAAVKLTDSVSDKVSEKTDVAKNTVSDAKKITGLAGMFGVDTSKVDSALGGAEKTVNKVDNVNATLNATLDKVQAEIIQKSKQESDKIIDEVIDAQVKKLGGGLGNVLLTDYKADSVSPLRRDTWGTASVVYRDLSKVKLSVFETIVGTVNAYFGWLAWGVMLIVWGLGAFIWFTVYKKVKMILAPFIVCPRCGNAFVSKSSAKGFLVILKPWKWF